MSRLSLWWQVLVAALLSRSNQQFYDRIAPIYERVFVTHTLHADKMADILAEHYKGRERATRVLDLGCGTGVLTRRVAVKGFDVLGLDISLQSLRMLRRYDPTIPTINASAARVPLVDGSCHAVVSLGAWRHFPQPQHVMAEVTRVLDKAGMLIVGYFPPALGGVVQQGSGILSRWLVRLYQWVLCKRGYVDRADSSLEPQTLALAGDHFDQVSTIASGKHWRLVVARSPSRQQCGSRLK